MTLSEKDIQAIFWLRRRTSYRLLVPNYTPDGWHECDLWGVTKSGYAHEFEIKISVSDFKADANKREGTKVRATVNEEGKRVWRRGQGRNKHERLYDCDPLGPVIFTYLVPEGLVRAEDVPEYAGLMYVLAGRYAKLVPVKEPMRRHKVVVPEAVVERAKNVFYYRYWQDRERTYAKRRAK